jgi:LysM repeat protein
MKLQIPKILTTRPAFLSKTPWKRKPVMKLRAATATRMKPGVEDDYDDEPQTRLSSAFFVVLILHVVAVGGIYAFNSIKEHRRGLDPVTASAKPAIEKPAAEPVATVPKVRAVPALEAPTRPAAPASAVAATATAPVSNAKVYHVKAGDTLTGIATSLGVSVAALQFVNTPKELATLRPGQIINVPAKKAADRTLPIEASTPAHAAKVTKPASAPVSYEVQKGDTATSIAKKFGVSVESLLALNKVSDPKKLQLGQTLKLPVKKN